MSQRHRIIIDTDPGVDDILAMLLAFSAKAEEIEVLLIGVTFGNVEVEHCLRNVVTLFHQIEKEMEWRRQNGRDEGFESLKKWKPIVAAGASEPLSDHTRRADYFHGIDGLGGIHHSHPHLSAVQTWSSLLEGTHPPPKLFTPSVKPSPDIMLDLLRSNPADSITIVSLGPLTTLAIAAAKEPETFLRVKEVVSMGGAIDVPGNITPLAEFNVYADSVAAARVYALTSPTPATTMPTPELDTSKLPAYPVRLEKPLRLTLVPLDITTPHSLASTTFKNLTNPLVTADPPGPLATWLTAFLASTFTKLSSLYRPDEPLSLHDPLCIWVLLTRFPHISPPDRAITCEPPPHAAHRAPRDVRVETGGQWANGACVVDRRSRWSAASSLSGAAAAEPASAEQAVEGLEAVEEVVPEGADEGAWLGEGGNRVWVCQKSGWVEQFGEVMIRRILGLEVDG